MRSTDGDGSTFTEDARRAQIIAAAVEVIAEEGFARASLARIAARVGITKGNVAYHLGSKDQLVRAVVETIYTEAAEGMRDDVVDASGHAERLAAYLRGNLDFLARNPVRVRALTEILTSFREKDGRLAYDESSVGSVLAPLEVLLRAGQADGDFRDFDVPVMARTVRAAIDAVTPQLGVRPDLDLAAYAEELVETFARATAR